MKRSEMVEILRQHIVNCDDLSVEDLEDQTDVASYILGILEKSGMTPPIIDHNRNYKKTNSDGTVDIIAYMPKTRVWEPE